MAMHKRRRCGGAVAESMANAAYSHNPQLDLSARIYPKQNHRSKGPQPSRHTIPPDHAQVQLLNLESIIWSAFRRQLSDLSDYTSSVQRRGHEKVITRGGLRLNTVHFLLNYAGEERTYTPSKAARGSFFERHANGGWRRSTICYMPIVFIRATHTRFLRTSAEELAIIERVRRRSSH